METKRKHDHQLIDEAEYMNMYGSAVKKNKTFELKFDKSVDFYLFFLNFHCMLIL